MSDRTKGILTIVVAIFAVPALCLGGLAVVPAVTTGLFRGASAITAPPEDLALQTAQALEAQQQQEPTVTPPPQDPGEEAMEVAPVPEHIDGVSGFTYAEGAAVQLNAECGYTGYSSYLGSEDTNPGAEVYVDGYDRGDDSTYQIWKISELVQLYGVTGAFHIVGDATDIAVADTIEIRDGVAYHTGYQELGNSGNTFVIDPEADGVNFLIMRNGAFHLIPDQDLDGYTMLRVNHLECRGKIRPVKIVGINPFVDPPFNFEMIALP